MSEEVVPQTSRMTSLGAMSVMPSSSVFRVPFAKAPKLWMLP